MVSFVVPVYNVSAALIDEAVESLLDLGPDVEVVVVDDGSTERDTVKCVADLRSRDARVKVVRQPNSGVATARNRGIREATHEWVAFLDPDDRCRVAETRSAIGSLAVAPYDLVVTGAAGIDFGGVEIERYELDHLADETMGTDLLTEMMSLYVYGRQSASFVLGVPWAKFVRRSFLCDHDLLFTDGLVKRSDAEWLIRLYEEVGPVAVVSLPTVDYRIDVPGNISRRFNPEILPAFEKLRTTAEKASVPEAVRQLYFVELLKDAINSVFSSPAAPASTTSRSAYRRFREGFDVSHALLADGHLARASPARKLLYVIVKRGWFMPIVLLREWKRLNA